MKKNISVSKKYQEITSHSEQETFSLAKELGSTLDGDELILLYGELGAGKTVFARGVAGGLDLEDIHQVCSPSFTLINIYQARYPIFHLDLYRIKNDAEISDLGWEDYLGQGVLIVEWAEKLHIDLKSIKVYFKIKENDIREIRIEY